MIELVLGVWMGALTLVWSAGFAYAVRRSGGNRWAVGPDDEPADPDVRVSVVVPARDEVDNIGALVASVLAQDHPSLELVVLDDGSTDGTGEVVRSFDDPRVRLVTGGDEPLPPGWLGKPWACMRASRHATGDWLLFVDADVRLAPEAVSRSVGYASREGVGLLSGLGHLDAVTLGERVMQPVVVGALLAANDLDDVNDPEQPDKALGNGQFLLFSRETYDAVGGHEAVRSDVLDDVGLARAVKRAGEPFRLVFMRRLFSCRMYRSGWELWAGWRKNLFPGVHWRWRNVLLFVSGQAVFVLAPYAVVALAAAGVLPRVWMLGGLAPILGIQGVRWHLDGVFGQPRALGVLTHGIATALLAALFVDSALATTFGWAKWKGRVLPGRGEVEDDAA